jgi:hypothetical protein
MDGNSSHGDRKLLWAIGAFVIIIALAVVADVIFKPYREFFTHHAIAGSVLAEALGRLLPAPVT